VGQADEGRQDAQEQVDHEIHRDLASQEQEEGLIHVTLDLERAVRRWLSAEEGRSRSRRDAL